MAVPSILGEPSGGRHGCGDRQDGAEERCHFVHGRERQNAGNVLIRAHDHEDATPVDPARLEDVVLGDRRIDTLVIDELERADPLDAATSSRSLPAVLAVLVIKAFTLIPCVR
jgi:hypothetical protein